MPQRWPDLPPEKPLRRNVSIRRETARPPAHDRITWHPDGTGGDRTSVMPDRTAEHAAVQRLRRNLEDLDRIAHHEAGHALVGWQVGMTPTGISVDLHGRSGETRLADHVVGVKARLASLHAGVVAERIVSGVDTSSTDGGRIDREQIRSLELIADPATRAGAVALAERLVRHGQEAVRALADVLIRKRYVSGDEALSIMREHWQPLPDDQPYQPRHGQRPGVPAAQTTGVPATRTQTTGVPRAKMSDGERRAAFPHLYGEFTRDYQWNPVANPAA